MEEMTFDISGILSEEEADKLFEETDNPETGEENAGEQENENENNNTHQTEEGGEAQPSESVGNDEDEDEKEEDTGGDKSRGSSPTVLSSIASALKADGIFPDFEDERIAGTNTPEDFAELVEEAIKAKMDERTRRIDEALGNGVKPDTIKSYEQTIGYLNSITEDAISAEGDEGEELRKQLIFNDLMNKGYSKERAVREVEKSFNSASDIDDAKDALDALKTYYANGYKKIQDDAKKKADEFRAAQKKQSEDFRKMVLEDEIKIGESKLDKRTCQKVFDAVSKPVYKDPDTGKLLTAVQKFQKEKPLEFLKQLGMWFVLTDGGKSVAGFTKQQVQAEKNKGIRELERKLKGNTFELGGSMRLDGGNGEGADDILLSDDWKIG